MPPADQDIRPPPNIRWLIDLLGEEAALRLVDVHAGTRFFVPKTLTARSELVRSTQLDAKVLAPLVRSLGGELLNLPLCREWRVRIYRSREGLTYSQIAQRLGITERAVWRILNNGGMTAQMELPNL
jgi:DNA-binding NarL/FixJ family response regulator